MDDYFIKIRLVIISCAAAGAGHNRENGKIRPNAAALAYISG
jgi:hypothetical protein